MCSHLTSCNMGCPLQPKLWSHCPILSPQPLMSSQKHSLRADASQDAFSRDAGKGIFCRPALTANTHSSALSTKITDPYYWNGLRVQPSWSSHISLYIITELPQINLSITPTSAGNSRYPPRIISSRASSLISVPTAWKWLQGKQSV